MRTLVTYISWTGTTRKIAEAIFDAISAPKDLMTFNEVIDMASYDVLFVGFPMHGTEQPAEEAVQFLKERCAGRKVALFLLHAAPEDSPYVPCWLDLCKDAARATQLLGLADFQGQASLELVDMILQSPDAKGRELLPFLVHSSLGQPDASRLQRARKFAADIMASQQAARTAQ